MIAKPGQVSGGASLLTRAASLAGLVVSAVLVAAPAAAHAPPLPAAASRPDAALLQALESAGAGDLSPVERLLPLLPAGSPERALLEAQSAAALLRDNQVQAALQRYFESGDADPARLQHARRLAAANAFFAGRYAEAAAQASSFLAASAALSPPEREGMERLRGIARLLADEPRQRLDSRGSGAPVATARDKVGLIRTRISKGAATEEAVLDTGANLSVASASAARRLGLRMLSGDAAVGNSLGGGVDVQLAIADRLEIAGAVLRNVVFLVMDDAALTFPVPGGYRIDAIVGLPALRALRRLTFGPGETLRLPPLEPRPTAPGNLRMAGSDPFVVARVAGREHPFFFDTGAGGSSLSARFAAEHPDLAGAPAGEVRRAGAGGSSKVRENRIERVPLRIGDAEALAPALRVRTETTPGEEERYGVLGADLFRMFDSVTLDFDHMRLEAVR